MKARIEGFQPQDYVSAKTGRQVKGVTLYLTVESSEVIGRKTQDQFVDAKLSSYQKLVPYLGGDIDSLIGADIFIDYNVEKRGNYTFYDVCDLEVYPKKAAENV